MLLARRVTTDHHARLSSNARLKRGGRTAMLYRTYPTALPLAEFVEYLWLFGDRPPHSRERIVPTGTLELVINLREDEIRIYDAAAADRCRRLSGAVVSGAYR